MRILAGIVLGVLFFTSSSIFAQTVRIQVGRPKASFGPMPGSLSLLFSRPGIFVSVARQGTLRSCDRYLAELRQAQSDHNQGIMGAAWGRRSDRTEFREMAADAANDLTRLTALHSEARKKVREYFPGKLDLKRMLTPEGTVFDILLTSEFVELIRSEGGVDLEIEIKSPFLGTIWMCWRGFMRMDRSGMVRLEKVSESNPHGLNLETISYEPKS